MVEHKYEAEQLPPFAFFHLILTLTPTTKGLLESYTETTAKPKFASFVRVMEKNLLFGMQPPL